MSWTRSPGSSTELLRHGLLTGSFVPDRPLRELRELTLYRTSLVRERTAAANRLQTTLEVANVKLASVATDILGKSGREILAARVAGETEGTVLVQLAPGRRCWSGRWWGACLPLGRELLWSQFA